MHWVYAYGHLCPNNLLSDPSRDKLGGAFFHPERRTVYLVEDTVEASEFDFARLRP